MTTDIGIGTRVASRRKLAGLTQAQLAQLTHYSLSTVRAVEQGREPASPAFTAAMARALKVEPEELTGVPYRDTINQGGPLEGLSDLRSILSEGQYVQPLEPESLDVLTAEMDAVNLLYRNDKGRQALARLPVLIRQMHGAVREAHSDADRALTHTLLSAGYVTAERLCRRFGYMSLCTPAVDRLEWAATQADDPLYVAQAKVKRARVVMYLDATDVSASLVERGLDDVSGDGEAATAVRGYAHLCGGLVSLRRAPDTTGRTPLARGSSQVSPPRHLAHSARPERSLHSRPDYTRLFGRPLWPWPSPSGAGTTVSPTSLPGSG